MRVAYAVRPGDHNPELQHSLRSLVNLDHDGVTIAGYIPSWITNTKTIPVRPASNKYASAAANWLAIAQHEPGPFIAMHDDMFALKPTEIRTWHRGPLVDHIRSTAGPYQARLRRTHQALVAFGIREPLSYALHVPMVLDPLLWQSLMHGLPKQGIDPTRVSLRSMYGNCYEIGGEQRPDVKQEPGNDFASTSDREWLRKGPISRMVQAAFPNPSPYETHRG